MNFKFTWLSKLWLRSHNKRQENVVLNKDEATRPYTLKLDGDPDLFIMLALSNCLSWAI